MVSLGVFVFWHTPEEGDSMFKMMKKDEGFTLVELMIVVLIIGILVAIAIPIFNNASAEAKKKTCAANIRTINGAINQMAAVDGTDPKTLATTPAELVTEGYLKEEPKCPVPAEPTAYTVEETTGFVADHAH